MKTITLALILALSVPLGAQSVSDPSGAIARACQPPTRCVQDAHGNVRTEVPVLTQVERLQMGRSEGGASWLIFLDSNCTVLNRKVVNGRDVIRFRCPAAVERVTPSNVGSGFEFVQPEPKGFAAFKAKLKTVGLYTAGAIIFAVIIYGKAQA